MPPDLQLIEHQSVVSVKSLRLIFNGIHLAFLFDKENCIIFFNIYPLSLLSGKQFNYIGRNDAMGYERVSSEAILQGIVRKESAWKIISDFPKYESIMANVDKVNIIERSEKEGKSEWFVTVEDAPLKWIERDHFDKENYEITFESIDGDFENINGQWRVEDCQDEGIKVAFSIDYNLGIPVIEEVLGHILKEKMKTNIDSMIHAIGNELTKSQVNDRQFPRFIIGKYNTIIVNGAEVRAFIVNVSRKGMMIHYRDECVAQNLAVEIGGLDIEAESMIDDHKSNKMRIIFKQSINEQQIENLVGFLNNSPNRENERHVFGIPSTITFGFQEYPVFLTDISPTGMLLKYDDMFEWLDDKFEVGGVILSAKAIDHDVAAKTVRVQFADTINEIEYASLLMKLNDSDVSVQQLCLAL
jgi:ribosome-associated toxin RatA of RatAB toxin-antitoxin module